MCTVLSIDSIHDADELRILQVPAVSLCKSVTTTPLIENDDATSCVSISDCDSQTASLTSLEEEAESISRPRVTFGLNQVSSVEQWSECEMSSAWYTEEEYHEMRATVRQDAQSAQGSDYENAVLNVFSACRGGNASSDGAKSAIIVAQSEFRGCEGRLFRDCMRRLRRDTVQRVLEVQEGHWRRNDADDDEECDDENQDIIEKMAELCAVQSKFSRRVAYLLAFGDAIVAANQYY